MNVKQKNPVLAALLGLLLGPLGTIYFGWRVLLSTLVIAFTTTLYVDWVFPFHFPDWFVWIVHIFFGFWNFLLAKVNNEGMAGDSIHGINFFFMVGWYIRFLIGFQALYTGARLLSDGKWGLALTVVILLAPLSVMFFEYVAAFVVALIMAGTDRIINKKNASDINIHASNEIGGEQIDDSFESRRDLGSDERTASGDSTSLDKELDEIFGNNDNPPK